MATEFGGVLLRGANGERKAGAIFELDGEVSSDRLLPLSSGWTVEFRRGSGYVVVHVEKESDPNQALDDGLDAVQQALDLLCVAEHQRLRVENYEREHMVWYKSGGASILRVTSVVCFGVSVRASAKIVWANGSTEAPNLYPMPAWNECFRYYRLAQVSEDPFDAFRNLWLSLELALSVKSAKARGEGEADWIRRVGRILQGSIPKGAWPSKGPDPVGDLVNSHYTDTRCRLFHAKAGKPRLNPLVTADRGTVVERFGTLLPFVREVLANVAGAPKGGGGLTYQGFQRAMQAAHGDGLILLSDSQEPLSREETVASPCWSGAKVVPGPRMANESRPGLELRGTRINVRDLAPAAICRIGLASKGGDGAAQTLFAASLRSTMLNLDDDFDGFEPVFGVELVNQLSPRARFRL